MALFIDGKQARGSLVIEGDLTQPMPTYKTASGSVATFETDMTENLISCVCEIVATQSGSGTPSPSNPRPITTYGEANIFNMSDITNKTFFEGLAKGTHGFVDMGSLSWNYTANYGGVFYAYITGKKFGRTNFVTPDFNTVDKDYSALSNFDATGTYSTTSINIRDNAYDNVTDFTNAMIGKYLIFELDTATTPISKSDFETVESSYGYSGTYYNIPFGQTVAKGVLDITTGKLRVTSKVVDLGSLNWIYSTTTTNPRFQTTDITDFKLPTNYFSDDYALSISSIYSDQGSWGVVLGDGSYDNAVVFGPNGEVSIVNHSYTDATTFKNAMSGVSLCYELATPIEIQCDSIEIPTINGTNNLFADTGNISEAKYILSVGEALEL